jgi:hypothetical protein
MQKFKFIKLTKDESDTSGSSLKGKLKYGIKYDDLVDMFGPPTYFPKDSGDGKVNFEWVVEFENENGALETYSIYDWKIDADYSMMNTGDISEAEDWLGGSRWHVGGKVEAGDFMECLEEAFDKGMVFDPEYNEDSLPF